jgi:hypothetical protein
MVNIIHPTTDITHPMGNIIHPTTDITHPMGNIIHPTTDITHPMGNIIHLPLTVSIELYCFRRDERQTDDKEDFSANFAHNRDRAVVSNCYDRT